MAGDKHQSSHFLIPLLTANIMKIIIIVVIAALTDTHVATTVAADRPATSSIRRHRTTSVVKSDEIYDPYLGLAVSSHHKEQQQHSRRVLQPENQQGDDETKPGDGNAAAAEEEEGKPPKEEEEEKESPAAAGNANPNLMAQQPGKDDEQTDDKPAKVEMTDEDDMILPPIIMDNMSLSMPPADIMSMPDVSSESSISMSMMTIIPTYSPTAIEGIMPTYMPTPAIVLSEEEESGATSSMKLGTTIAVVAVWTVAGMTLFL